MPPAEIVRTRCLPRVSWKNGAGTTRQIAVGPEPAGSTDFQWRLSVADIDRDSAFSTFSGADRHFLVASPGYVHMNINGERLIAACGRPETFPGEADVAVKLAGGPISVINLITQRAVWTGHIHIVRLNGTLVPRENAVALVLLDGTGSTPDGRRLEPLDFLLAGPGMPGVKATNSLVAIICISPVLPTVAS